MSKARFGVRRLVHPGVGTAERLLFRAIGVADPAHYLHHLYFRRALDRMRLDGVRSILDAGCGRGDHTLYLAQRFPGARVLGVDLDESRIAMNRTVAERLGLTNVSFEVRDLLDRSGSDRFDLVVSIDVLEHIVEQERVLASLLDAMNPGGHFFFHIPTERGRPVPFSNRLAGLHEWASEEHTAKERSADEFVEVLRRVGFEVKTVERTFGYYTGEMATSLFCLPFEPTPRNRVLQGLMAPFLRLLVLADPLGIEEERYAVAVSGQRR